MITTVVGSFPAQAELDRGQALDLFYAARRADPFEGAIRDAVECQVEAGIDWASDGQVRADMVTLFSAHIPGLVVRRGRTTVVGPVDVPRSPIARADFLLAQGVAGRRARVKGILTGPSTMALSCSVAGAYRDERDLQLAHDLALVQRREAEELVAAGAVAVQVDEPFFSAGAGELDARLEEVDLVARGLGVPVALHVCGDVRSIADRLLALRHVSIVDCEFAASPANLGAFTREAIEGAGKRVGIGCVRTDTAEVEPVEEIAKRIRAGVERLGAENIIVDPDCGMRNLPRDSARAKLANMVAAARMVERELEGKG